MSTWQTCRTASCQQLPVLVFEQHRRQSRRAGRAGADHRVAQMAEATNVYLKALRRRGARAHVKGERIRGSGKLCLVVLPTILAHGNHIEASKGRNRRA